MVTTPALHYMIIDHISVASSFYLPWQGFENYLISRANTTIFGAVDVFLGSGFEGSKGRFVSCLQLMYIRVAHNLQKVRYEKISHLLKVLGYIGWENKKNQFVSMHTYRSHAPPNL